MKKERIAVLLLLVLAAVSLATVLCYINVLWSMNFELRVSVICLIVVL